jgi:hypothetical protein
MLAKRSLFVLSIIAIVAAFSAACSESGQAQSRQATRNGFDISYSIIPTDQIFGGGPPKDGIPAITDPNLVSADKAKYMRPDDIVVGVTFGGKSRAYPLRILVWHENVNDTVGGVPVAVTYCPLCRSVLVFDRRIDGVTREFGISGLLWNSNVLLYDRQKNRDKESLWSQAHMKAVTGPAAREKLGLKLLPSEMTSWREWLAHNPETTVLSKRTGYSRNYDSPLYATYFQNDRLMFPVRQIAKRPERFKNKEPLIVVNVGEKWKAYSLRDVASAAGTSGFIEDTVGGKRLRLEYSKESGNARAELVEERTEVPTAYMYWFALAAMLPEAEVYEPPASQNTGG